MSGIKQIGRRYRIALIVLLALCLGELGILLSPMGASAHTREERVAQLRAELRAKAAANGPFQDIESKVAEAQDQVGNFYRDRLPASYASLSERLDAVAAKANVSLTTGHYKAEPSGVPGLQHLVIDASVTGEYLHAVQFINATEREQMFFVVNSVSLTQQQGSTVQLQIRIEAFLKEA